VSDSPSIQVGAVVRMVDVAQSFHVESLDARGRLARLGPVLDEVLSAHSYPAPVTRLLAEALTLTALIGVTLATDEGAQVTLQVRSDGPASLLVCDYMAPGAIRGYCGFDPARIAGLSGDADLPSLAGSGYLALTIDTSGEAKRYQGIVDLDSPTLQDVAQRYFENSEQLGTWLRMDVRHDAVDDRWLAGGVLLQHLPRGEEGGPRLFAKEHPDEKWRHAVTLLQTLTAEELTDPSVGFDVLLWRLFHQERVLVHEPFPLSKGCRCSIERIQAVLRQFSFEDLMEMREPDGSFRVNCAFCSRDWIIERPEPNDR